MWEKRRKWNKQRSLKSSVNKTTLRREPSGSDFREVERRSHKIEVTLTSKEIGFYRSFGQRQIRKRSFENSCARTFYPFLKSIVVIKRTKSLGCESYNLRLAQTPCCRQFKNKTKNSSGSNFKNYGVARYRSKRQWFGQGIDLTWFFDFVLVLSLPHSQGLFQDNYAWRRELSSDESQAKMKLRWLCNSVESLSCRHHPPDKRRTADFCATGKKKCIFETRFSLSSCDLRGKTSYRKKA